MLRRLLLSILILAGFSAEAQPDTIRVATYNVLHYGRPQANRYALKNTYLRPILAEIKPSIICFNEVDTTISGILDTLNTAMPYAMNHGAVHNTTNTDILDGLFWKSGKFRLLRDTIISNYVRDIVAYDLYYDDPLLGISHDTVKLKVITAHLKSSNGVPDRVLRDTETRRVIRYLDQFQDTLNIVMMGDFNLYRSSEAAYQNLTAPANVLSRLNDPTNMPGIWDGQTAFAPIHTQSPRLLQLSDEGASGGLDSRFDFVLLSDAIMNGWKGVQYLPATYTVFGNDGQHFNKALTDAPAHPTLPASIIQALYNVADHLPVYTDLVVTPKSIAVPNAIPIAASTLNGIKVANPFSETINYYITDRKMNIGYKLLSAQGMTVQSGFLDPQRNRLNVHADLAPGLYLFLLKDDRGNTAVHRMVHE